MILAEHPHWVADVMVARLEKFFAPVVSTDRAIELIEEGSARRAKA